MSRIPEQSRVVIVGGGVVGASVAFHLTELGWSDVVLLERYTLTSGTTWHAAGLVAQLRATESLTRLSRYSLDLYQRLEDETGQSTGFRAPGAISLATTPERFVELQRTASMARHLGVGKPDPEKLTYVRNVRPTARATAATKPRPNVIVVLLESFAAHHCGAMLMIGSQKSQNLLGRSITEMLMRRFENRLQTF